MSSSVSDHPLRTLVLQTVDTSLLHYNTSKKYDYAPNDQATKDTTRLSPSSLLFSPAYSSSLILTALSLSLSSPLAAVLLFLSSSYARNVSSSPSSTL